MNKNDCDIVRDLSLGYIEDLLTSNSKNFVREHLSECSKCKEYYNYMKTNIMQENNIADKNKDKVEINYLKKIRQHMNTLRIILIIILIIIVLVIGIFTIKYYTINNIINKTYNQIEYMKNVNNYKLTKKTIYKTFSDNSNFNVTYNYYYKDGKYKIEYGNNSTIYLEDDSYNKICVYDDLKQIEYHTQEFKEETKGNIMNTFFKGIKYKKEYTKIDILGLLLREDRFEGINCYVIKHGNNDCYKEVWINKDNYSIVRIIEEEKTKYYNEEIYTFQENIVNSENVDSSILNSERYKEYRIIENINNATQEMKLYYEILNKK